MVDSFTYLVEPGLIKTFFCDCWNMTFLPLVDHIFYTVQDFIYWGFVRCSIISNVVAKCCKVCCSSTLLYVELVCVAEGDISCLQVQRYHDH